jgi:hypothetical protein
MTLLLAGCQFLERRLESAAYFSATSAGYAGRYRIAFGRWPNVAELEEFTCMPGRADKFGLAQISCDEVVTLPYRTELTPQGKDLRLRYFARSDGALLCSLRLRATELGADTNTFPRIVIQSTIFSCTGSGWNRTRTDTSRGRLPSR